MRLAYLRGNLQVIGPTVKWMKLVGFSRSFAHPSFSNQAEDILTLPGVNQPSFMVRWGGETRQLGSMFLSPKWPLKCCQVYRGHTLSPGEPSGRVTRNVIWLGIYWSMRFPLHPWHCMDLWGSLFFLGGFGGYIFRSLPSTMSFWAVAFCVVFHIVLCPPSRLSKEIIHLS